MSKKWLFLLALVVAGICTGGYFANEQRDMLSAQWHFSNGSFPLIAVEKQAGQVIVKLQASHEQADMDVITYRNCPYQDEAIWKFQSQDKISLAYYVVDEASIKEQSLEKAAALSKEEQNEEFKKELEKEQNNELKEKILEQLKEKLQIKEKAESKVSGFTEVAVTLCDRDWSVSREVNVLSALDGE